MGLAHVKFKKKLYPVSFSDLADSFGEKLQNFDYLGKSFSIEDYFGKGIGLQTALKLLHRDKKIKKLEDFRGLYIYMDDKMPFYVGISKCVVKRTLQHTKGHNHQTSSLAYRLGQINYEHQTKMKWEGTRDAFEFKKYCGDAKNFLRCKRIAFLPIEDETELILFEVYCAMELGTEMNYFQTH